MLEKAPPTELPDAVARKIALTAIDRSLLVEAGAGSGKTSILAGRIAVLLASGVKPKHIAAITFTEFAASELLIRVDRFVQALAAGTVPRDLEIAFPDGVQPQQLQNLKTAVAALDQLTCSTIHGFAQALIKPYPVEANIDPGASIIDPAEAELAFTERFEAWLKKHLSEDPDDDIVAELVLADEAASLKLVREVATFLKANRDAQLSDGRWIKGPVDNFEKTVTAFRTQLNKFKFREATTEGALEGFELLEKLLGALDLVHDDPSARSMLGVINLPTPPTCFTKRGEPRKLRTKSKWIAAAAAAGLPKAKGEEAFAAACNCYDACHTALNALSELAAGELLGQLVGSMQRLMVEWRDYKRAAALLDFDDLLYKARDLLLRYEPVRQALANRFCHVLVDEFQDTDPLQIEILWRLCGDPAADRNANALARKLRPGALFLVGDPKQAIYRFRGADVNAYVAAREAMGRKAFIEITANFRSLSPILEFVNSKFASPLAKKRGQPGFTALAPTLYAAKDEVTVAALDIVSESDDPSRNMLRDAEAKRVAELCRRLIDNWMVRDPENNVSRRCRAGDIALLAPVGTELWRFEEALESQGIPVSTQAGKGFFNRQEIQDLIALTRAIADGRDTLALGSLLRGPLVGLTETELLDIAEGLPTDPAHPDRMVHLNIRSRLEHVNNDIARLTLERLQALARRARSTTPYFLLADAIDALAVRPQLRQRFGAGAERALANVDLYLELANAYDVRGLRAFARDMRANWEDAVRQVEGRPDAVQESVALITIHSAKGLEWPIVIPINATGDPLRERKIIYHRAEGKFSMPLLSVLPPAYTALQTRNDEEQSRERVRLWYVATTRARDLLILPRHSTPLSDKSWALTVDLDLPELPSFDVEQLPNTRFTIPEEPDNPQTKAIFGDEAKRIAATARKLRWVQPSRHEYEPAKKAIETAIYTDAEKIDETAIMPVVDVAGSATRGTILHKLMEEILTGETKDDLEPLTNRATELLSHLTIKPSTDPSVGIAPRELAETIVRTLHLPEIVNIRQRLVPEVHTYARGTSESGESLISGISDAVAIGLHGAVEAVIDWKSDVDPSVATLNTYRDQLTAYCRATNAARGLLILMTPGKIVEVSY
jgi:exodeoxyribonuclease-5